MEKETNELLDKHGNKVETETLFEKFFFLERFYNKNKKKIIFSVAVTVLGGFAYLVDNMLDEYRADTVNQAYYNYQQGIEPERSLAIIKEFNSKLYNLIIFSKTMKENNSSKLEEFAKSEDRIISDLAQYQLYSLKKETQKLNEYSYKERAIFRDLAIISESYSLINSGDIEQAHNRLSFIEETSPVRDLANYLQHFGVVQVSYDASTDEFIKE